MALPATPLQAFVLNQRFKKERREANQAYRFSRGHAQHRLLVGSFAFAI